MGAHQPHDKTGIIVRHGFFEFPKCTSGETVDEDRSVGSGRHSVRLISIGKHIGAY